MNLSIYIDRPDWESTTTYWNGSTETFKHCGRCLSVIPGVRCEHCSNRDAKAKASLEEFLKHKEMTS